MLFNEMPPYNFRYTHGTILNKNDNITVISERLATSPLKELLILTQLLCQIADLRHRISRMN